MASRLGGNWAAGLVLVLPSYRLTALGQLEQGGENSLRHPPQHSYRKVITRRPYQGSIPSVLGRAKHTGAGEGLERHPPGRGDLPVGGKGSGCRGGENERSNYQWRKHRAASGQIVELADQLSPAEVKANLFESFPTRGRQEIGIVRPSAPAGKGQMAGPDITVAVGALNEKDGIGLGGQHNRHGSPGPAGISVRAQSALGQPGGQCRKDTQLIRDRERIPRPEARQLLPLCPPASLPRMGRVPVGIEEAGPEPARLHIPAFRPGARLPS